MAPQGVTCCREAIVSVQDGSPDIQLSGIGGSVAVEAVVTVGMWMLTTADQYRYLEIPNYLYAPDAGKELYPVRSAGFVGVTHRFDDVNQLCLPCGETVQFSSTPQGYPLHVWYGKRPPSTIVHVLPAQATARMWWRRLGYPTMPSWALVHRSIAGFDTALPTMKSDTVPAIARGRMKAKPFHMHSALHVRPAPLAKLYMDFAGPVIRSFVHGYTVYCGVADEGSGYARVFPSHDESAEVARVSLRAYLADARSKRGSDANETTVVRGDNKTFNANEFKEFVETSVQARHSLACVYTPQQNHVIERFWGNVFALARILLASCLLPPAFHPYALQTACWILNRRPSPDRDGQSPYQVLTNGAKPDVSYLRAFGCACTVFLSEEQRTDKKLGARSKEGIYLGPSELHPGHVVFLLGHRRFITSRHVQFDESRFPSPRIHSIAFKWFDAEDDDHEDNKPAARRDAAVGPMDDQENSPPNPSSAQSSPSSARSPLRPASPAAPPAPSPPTTRSATATQRMAAQGITAPGAERMARLTEQSNAPQFVRHHPRRSTRTGPHAYYTDPTTASPRAATVNFMLHALASTPMAPSFAYQSAAGYAAVVRPTADLGDVQVPTSYKAALASAQSEYWRAAMRDELAGLLERRTWDSMPMDAVPENTQILNCHFVYDLKRKACGAVEKFKARLVADGDKQQSDTFNRIFSTVVKLSTVRVLLVLACHLNYDLSSADVRQAFLQADILEDIYMRCPPGLPRFGKDGERLVLKLRRSLYGLKQAARCWTDLFVSFLTTWGFVQSTIDTCLYTCSTSDGIILMVVWVDDCILATSTTAVRSRFVADLNKRFPITDNGELTWVLGVSVKRERRSHVLMLSQQLYIADLLKTHAPHAPTTSRRFDSPMSDDMPLDSNQCPADGSPEHARMLSKHESYMSVVGALLWLAAFTRPDITYAVSVLARFVSNPAEAHFVAMQRVLAYLHATQHRVLRFAPTKDSPTHVYSDASWSERYSTAGMIFMFLGCPVAWHSRLIRSVSHSSAEAEYVAASMAAREGIFLRDSIVDLNALPTGPTPMLLDSKSAIDMAFDPVAFKKTKHILRDAFYLRDLVARMVYHPTFVPSADQLADICTKPLPRHVFQAIRDRLLHEP